MRKRLHFDPYFATPCTRMQAYFSEHLPQDWQRVLACVVISIEGGGQIINLAGEYGGNIFGQFGQCSGFCWLPLLQVRFLLLQSL